MNQNIYPKSPGKKDFEKKKLQLFTAAISN